MLVLEVDMRSTCGGSIQLNIEIALGAETSLITVHVGLRQLCIEYMQNNKTWHSLSTARIGISRDEVRTKPRRDYARTTNVKTCKLSSLVTQL